MYTLDTFLSAISHPWMSVIRLILIGKIDKNIVELHNMALIIYRFNLVLLSYFWLCVQSLYQIYRRLDTEYLYLLS